MRPDQDEPTDDDMAVALDPNEPKETVPEYERRTGTMVKVLPGTPDEQGDLEPPGKEPPRPAPPGGEPPRPPPPGGGEPPRPPPRPPPGNEPPRPPMPPQPPGGGEPPRPPPGGAGGAAKDNFIHAVLAAVDAFRRASGQPGTEPPRPQPAPGGGGTEPPRPGGGTERPRG